MPFGPIKQNYITAISGLSALATGLDCICRCEIALIRDLTSGWTIIVNILTYSAGTINPVCGGSAKCGK